MTLRNSKYWEIDDRASLHSLGEDVGLYQSVAWFRTYNGSFQVMVSLTRVAHDAFITTYYDRSMPFISSGDLKHACSYVDASLHCVSHPLLSLIPLFSLFVYYQLVYLLPVLSLVAAVQQALVSVVMLKFGSSAHSKLAL